MARINLSGEKLQFTSPTRYQNQAHHELELATTPYNRQYAKQSQYSHKKIGKQKEINKQGLHQNEHKM